MKLLSLLPIFIVAANAAAIHDKRADNQPIVILDENEPHLKTDKFEDGSWGSTCNWSNTEGAMVCEITDVWGAYAAHPKLSYTGGTLAITMKVKDKNKKVQLQCSRPSDPDPKKRYDNFATNIEWNTEYQEKTFDVPDYVNDSKYTTHDPVMSLAIQATGEKNTFYIKKMVYTPGPKSTFEPIVKQNNNAQTNGNTQTGNTQQTGTTQQSDNTQQSQTDNTQQTGTTQQSDNTQQSQTGTGGQSGTGSQPGTDQTGQTGTGDQSGTGQPSDNTQTGQTGTTQPSTKTTGTNTSTTPTGDNTNGSTTVKVVLFNIVVAQLILLLLL